MNESHFSIEQPIIWGDMDAFNHINNTVYFRYFENARIAYFDKTGINQMMAKSKIGPILGESSCRYLKPLTYPDTIRIFTYTSALRPKRFTMKYLIESKKLGSVVAEGSGEIVYLDYNSDKTALIPDSIREAIIALDKNDIEIID